MILKPEPKRVEKRTEVPFGISMYSMLYLLVKKTAFLDTFALTAGIIFKIELRLIVAVVLTVVLKRFYCSLLIQTMSRFKQREMIFEWLKGKGNGSVNKTKPQSEFNIIFSVN